MFRNGIVGRCGWGALRDEEGGRGIEFLCIRQALSSSVQVTLTWRGRLVGLGKKAPVSDRYPVSDHPCNFSPVVHFSKWSTITKQTYTWTHIVKSNVSELVCGCYKS